VLKQQVRAEYTGRPFSAVIDDFIDKYAKVRQRQWYETQRILKKDFRAWDKWPITAIGREDIQTVLDTIKDRSLRWGTRSGGRRETSTYRLVRPSALRLI